MKDGKGMAIKTTYRYILGWTTFRRLPTLMSSEAHWTLRLLTCGLNAGLP